MWGHFSTLIGLLIVIATMSSQPGEGRLLADLSNLVAFLSCALGLAGGVAQGKDDWALVEGGHVPQNLLREGSCDGSNTYREKVGSGKAYSV